MMLFKFKIRKLKSMKARYSSLRLKLLTQNSKRGMEQRKLKNLRSLKSQKDFLSIEERGILFKQTTIREQLRLCGLSNNQLR